MLEQRMQQTQRQIVTPSQLQGLELLAMNGAELADFVNQEQLENPLLEVEPEAGPGISPSGFRIPPPRWKTASTWTMGAPPGSFPPGRAAPTGRT